jgi:FtsH-binding integral membrane protein
MSSAPDYLTQDRDVFAIDAIAEERAAFIRRTYAHVFAAIVAYVALAGVILNTGLGESLARMMMGGQWLLVLGAYMIASFAANAMARSGASAGVQYLGLMLYTVAFAGISAPLLWIAQLQTGGTGIIVEAGVLTLVIFGVLTAVVMFTGADFSFMRTALMVGGFSALALIVVAAFTGFNLGIWFVGGMIILMAGYILYDTSNILHHYRTDQHVAAALALFASLATLFWYVLRLLMHSRR